MPTDSVSSTKPRILVVDDSKVMRYAARKIIGEEYDVIEACDGEEAWLQLQSDKTIQVVLSDLGMPKLDGFGLLNRVREAQEERLNEMPFIVITGKEDDEDTQHQAWAGGATDFIAKPFDSVQLRARTRAHVRFGETARRLSAAEVTLAEESTTDRITGLANERYFFQRGEEALSFALRHSTSLALLCVSVDDIARFDGHYGSTAVQQVLRALGGLLRSHIRQEDTVASTDYGHFALLLPSTTEAGADKLAERVRGRVAEATFEVGGIKIPITVSIGVTAPPTIAGLRFKELFSAAKDNARMAAERGGDRVVLGEAPEIIYTSNGEMLDLEGALQMVRTGQQERVEPYLPGLMERLAPLLELADRRLDLSLEQTLARIEACELGATGSLD